jgi:hypothetical protein
VYCNDDDVNKLDDDDDDDDVVHLLVPSHRYRFLLGAGLLSQLHQAPAGPIQNTCTAMSTEPLLFSFRHLNILAKNRRSALARRSP